MKIIMVVDGIVLKKITEKIGWNPENRVYNIYSLMLMYFWNFIQGQLPTLFESSILNSREESEIHLKMVTFIIQKDFSFYFGV